MDGVSPEARNYLEKLLGEVPPVPPVQETLGATLEAVSDGEATFSLEASKALHNFVHVVHGGVLTSLAELAASMAIITKLDEDEAFTFIQQNTTYERPVVRGQVLADATVVRKGRRISLISVHLRNGQSGKEVGRAHFTALSQPIAGA